MRTYVGYLPIKPSLYPENWVNAAALWRSKHLRRFLNSFDHPIGSRVHFTIEILSVGWSASQVSFGVADMNWLTHPYLPGSVNKYFVISSLIINQSRRSLPKTLSTNLSFLYFYKIAHLYLYTQHRQLCRCLQLQLTVVPYAPLHLSPLRSDWLNHSMHSEHSLSSLLLAFLSLPLFIYSIHSFSLKVALLWGFYHQFVQ